MVNEPVETLQRWERLVVVLWVTALLGGGVATTTGAVCGMTFHTDRLEPLMFGGLISMGCAVVALLVFLLICGIQWTLEN